MTICFVRCRMIANFFFFSDSSEQTTQSTSTATSTAQQTIQQTVQLPGAPEGLTVVAQIPHDLILREAIEDTKETEVKTEAGTTPVALIKRGGVKGQAQGQNAEEFIAQMQAGAWPITTSGSVADYITRLASIDRRSHNLNTLTAMTVG